MHAPSDVFISFVVPAYNEEALIGDTLDSLLHAAEVTGHPFEVIVVDDASTDRTVELAEARGVRVERVSLRQIGAVRNSGARVSGGEILVFVDADTRVPPETLGAAIKAVEDGAVGGGARVDFDEIPFIGRVFWRTFAFFYHLLGNAAGCFVFCRRVDFEAVGGFDERYFISEEVHLSSALRKRGKFVILRERVMTSGRKCRLYTWRQTLGLMFRILFQPGRLRRREGLEFWYDGKREG